MLQALLPRLTSIVVITTLPTWSRNTLLNKMQSRKTWSLLLPASSKMLKLNSRLWKKKAQKRATLKFASASSIKKSRACVIALKTTSISHVVLGMNLSVCTHVSSLKMKCCGATFAIHLALMPNTSKVAPVPMPLRLLSIASTSIKKKKNCAPQLKQPMAKSHCLHNVVKKQLSV